MGNPALIMVELEDMYHSYHRWLAVGDRVRRQYGERFTEQEMNCLIRQAREEDLIAHQELCFEDDFYAWLASEDHTQYCIDQTREQYMHGASQQQVQQGLVMESIRLNQLWEKMSEFIQHQVHWSTDDLLDRMARLEYVHEHLKYLLDEADAFHESSCRRRWASSNWKGPGK